jgi:fermentation-respiration switch protein FrsA (DUF1100 family)
MQTCLYCNLPLLQEVHIRTARGLRLLAWYLPAAPGKPVLAYFHGNGGNLENRIPRIQRAATVGWGVFMVEYPGYGGNPGSPSEAAFLDAAASALAFLDAQHIDGGRIVVYGESIGTGVATRIAGGRKIAALVLEAPFTSALDVAARKFGFLPVRWLMRDTFDQASVIGRVRAPVLIMHGSDDLVVPPDLGRALYDASPEPKRLWIAPRGGHEDLMAFGAWTMVVDFVEQAMSSKPLIPPAAIYTAAPRQ